MGYGSENAVYTRNVEKSFFFSFRLFPIRGRHSGDNRTEDFWQCFTPNALPATTYW